MSQISSTLLIRVADYVLEDIETRAKAVCEQIVEAFPGRDINIIGHSMVS